MLPNIYGDVTQHIWGCYPTYTVWDDTQHVYPRCIKYMCWVTCTYIGYVCWVTCKYIGHICWVTSTYYWVYMLDNNLGIYVG